MKTRAWIVGVVALAASATAGQAEPIPGAATAEARQQVLDWLSAASQFEFQGTIEFTKRMRLPADPSRAAGAEHARRDVARIKEQYDTQMDAIKNAEGEDVERLRETVTASYERSLAQNEELMRHFEAWATKGVEIEQHWQVLYVSPDDLRVEFSSRTVDPPQSALIPMTQIQATSGGQAWSRMSLKGAGGEQAAHPVRNPEFVRQARSELDKLLQGNMAALSAEALSDVELDGDAVVATFDHGRPGDAVARDTTTLTFDRMDDSLWLRSAESEYAGLRVVTTYDDYRMVSGRAVAFRTSVRSSSSDDTETASTYRIVSVESGVTPDDVKLLAMPVADASEQIDK